MRMMTRILRSRLSTSPTRIRGKRQMKPFWSLQMISLGKGLRLTRLSTGTLTRGAGAAITRDTSLKTTTGVKTTRLSCLRECNQPNSTMEPSKTISWASRNSTSKGSTQGSSSTNELHSCPSAATSPRA